MKKLLLSIPVFIVVYVMSCSSSDEMQTPTRRSKKQTYSDLDGICFTMMVKKMPNGVDSIYCVVSRDTAYLRERDKEDQ